MQVIEQVPKDVLYDFLCSYAQEHEELAMAFVSEFWQAEKDDYRSMVQQCLMHPSPAGVKNGDGYDWGAIAADLAQMMNLADEKVKEKIHFIEIAFGSMTEVFCELQTACDLHYIEEEQLDALRPQLAEVAKMMSGLKKSFETKV